MKNILKIVITGSSDKTIKLIDVLSGFKTMTVMKGWITIYINLDLNTCIWSNNFYLKKIFGIINKKILTKYY